MGSSLVRGSCGKCNWLSPHRTTLPVRADQVTAAPYFTRQISSRLMCYLLKIRGPGQQWLNSGSPPASWFPCQRLLRTSPSSYFQGCVPRANRRPLKKTLLEHEQRMCSSTVASVFLSAVPSFRRSSVFLSGQCPPAEAPKLVKAPLNLGESCRHGGSCAPSAQLKIACKTHCTLRTYRVILAIKLVSLAD